MGHHSSVTIRQNIAFSGKAMISLALAAISISRDDTDRHPNCGIRTGPAHGFYKKLRGNDSPIYTACSRNEDSHEQSRALLDRSRRNNEQSLGNKVGFDSTVERKGLIPAKKYAEQTSI
jgi:hypothetical protein